MKNIVCTGDHKNHFCAPAEKERIEEIVKQAKKPQYVCFQCGRVADNKTSLQAHADAIVIQSSTFGATETARGNELHLCSRNICILYVCTNKRPGILSYIRNRTDLITRHLPVNGAEIMQISASKSKEMT